MNKGRLIYQEIPLLAQALFCCKIRIKYLKVHYRNMLISFLHFLPWHSTIGNLEGQWAMQGKPLTNLSVEQVVDCDSNKDPARYAVF